MRGPPHVQTFHAFRGPVCVLVLISGSLSGRARVPVVHEINRYADLEEGEDKLSCAGSIDAYVRGSIAA